MQSYPKHDSPAIIIKIKGHQLYYLRPPGSLSIGRSLKNNIILDDSTVSRHHAIIRWDQKYPLITDQNSTAGTEIDGKLITFRHLYNDHLIKLGNTKLEIKFVKYDVDCPTEIELLNFKAKDAILTNLDEADVVTLFEESGSKDIAGYLSNTNDIHKLLIQLELSKRTGTLKLTEQNKTGTLIFGLGKIKEAHFEKKIGLVALQHICNFPRGAYHFTINISVGEYSLNESPACYLRNIQRTAKLDQIQLGSTLKNPKQVNRD